MTFAAKLANARLTLNMSQFELAEKAGVSERSIVAYEQTGARPRGGVLQKLAEALRVSVTYLTDENETDRFKNIEHELFVGAMRDEYGLKGAKEAREVISRASALFAGGDLDDAAKEVFYQSLMEVYRESKAEAREKFAPRRRASRKKQGGGVSCR